MSIVVEELAERISKSEGYLNSKSLMFKKYASSLVGEKVDFSREELKKFIFSLQVFSKSSRQSFKEEARQNLAMAIDVCLDEFPELVAVASNIFLEHGDFPNIPLLSEKKGVEVELGSITRARNFIREDINRIEGIDYAFTDFQRELWEDLRSQNDVIVVAPTSAGKTHVILTYLVRKIIGEDSGFYVVIVPTRALITEVSSNIYDLLNEYNGENIDVCTVPNKEEYSEKTIFVMTQERLYELVLRGDLNFDLLFVDEAHNISDHSRGVLLHMTIERMLEDSSPQVVISMPSKAYENAFSTVFPATNFVSVINDHSTVSKIMMNVVPSGRKLHISPIDGDYGIEISKGFKAKDLADIVLRLGEGESNLVFANRTNNCEDLAARISQRLSVDTSEELEEAASYVSDLIHPEFTLADNLKKSVAFHYGPLPTSVRVMVESLAKQNHIRYIVCTSTLAEGINLPAKNLFLKNPLIPVKGEPSKRMKDVQIKNIVGRAGRMTKHFSGNVFLVEPKDWEFEDYFEDKEDADKIPGYQDSINKNWFDIISLLNTGDVGEGKFELYSIANKLLKDFGRGVVGDVIYSDLIELKEDQKVALLTAVENAHEGMDVPVFILEANPTIGYLQQNNLYAFLKSIDDLDNWVVPHPLAKDLHAKLVQIFEKLEMLGIYKPTQGYSISQVCLIAKKWIGSNPLSEIISDQINWDKIIAREHGKGDPKVNSSVRKVIKSINDDVRFRMSNSLKSYVEILDLVLATSNNESKNVRLNYYFEIGSSIDEVISLINLGLSRESSLGVRSVLASSREIVSKQQLSSCMQSGELNSMHKIALQEIKNLLD